MKLTLLSHFYNEEYLLPWWLNHHKGIFDHGIMINYDSTDRSVDIIKEICPTWEIYNSKNKYFSAYDIDNEMNEYELKCQDYKLILNTTEFLVLFTDLRQLLNSYNMVAISRATIVDNNIQDIPSHEEDLILHKNYGFIGDNDLHLCWRFMHKYPRGEYLGGDRHSINQKIDLYLDPNSALIFWYGFSPWTPQLIQRKMQIKARMSLNDKQTRAGYQHQWSLEEMQKVKQKFLTKSSNLLNDDLIVKYLETMRSNSFS